MDAAATVRRFVDAINRADVDALCDLMSDDHVFVDSDGAKVRGREVMRTGWTGYFSMFPDYRIEAAEVLTAGPTVVLIGTASGTYARGRAPESADRWSVPAAWRAVVRDDRVALWQVFVNPEPVRKILERRVP